MDESFQNTKEVMIENANEFAVNQNFTVNISELIPFTTYYYIIWSSNLAGNTSTEKKNFTTKQAGS